MAELDIAFRHLLRGLPQPALALAFPHRRIEPIGHFDSSVDRPRQRTSDRLFRVRDSEGEAAVHIEVEREWRAALPSRLFDYATSAVTGTQLPVWSVVLLLKPGGRPPDGTGVYRIRGADGDSFVFRYRVVPLWQLDAHQWRDHLGAQGAPYCVAMRGVDPEFVQKLAEGIRTDSQLTRDERESIMQCLYMMTTAILGVDAVERSFPMEWMRDDPNIQELIRRWVDRGRVEGRVEGQAIAMRQVLYKVLASRSFTVPPDVRERIDGETDAARLEVWYEAALRALTLDDVFALDRSAAARRARSLVRPARGRGAAAPARGRRMRRR
jgi:hypothetical protein